MSGLEIPSNSIGELLEIKNEPGMPSLKVSDPLSVVEMALEVEVERARATEALAARDAAIQRLSDAYVSLRQKMAVIERLQQVPQATPPHPVNEQVVALEMTIKTLRADLAMASGAKVPVKSVDPPPSYDENGIDNLGHNAQLIRPASRAPPLRVPRETPPPTRQPSTAPDNNTGVILSGNDLDYQVQTASPQLFYTVLKSSESEDIIKARHALLATIPLPADPPDDTLKPIVIPPPFTLHEFLANASGVTPTLRTFSVY
ncbi:hypothetical protein C8R43DRAFT_1045129 [Mycena crocata]|nr:hypothetical protein C8R43DRAFT_1045129 [Mycena crocata]